MTLLSGRSGNESDGSAPTDGEVTGPRNALLRRLALATGIVAAIAYLASRRAGSGEEFPTIDEVRESAEEALPRDPDDVMPGEAHRIPIGDTGSEGGEDESSDETESPSGSGLDGAPSEEGFDEGPDDERSVGEASGRSDDETVDDRTEGDFGDERSDEELAEMTDPDADETPAEPGEMTVDEDVVEDAMDEDLDTDSDEGESNEDARDGS